MSLEVITALTQAGIGALVIIAVIIFVYRFPQNAQALREIVDQIRLAAENGIERVEGANVVLGESVKMLKEVSQSAIESRNRLESRYDGIMKELSDVKRDTKMEIDALKALLQEKDREIAALKLEIEQVRRAEKEKDQTVETLKKQLADALKERDDLLRRIEAVEKAQSDIKPAETKPDEKAA